MMDTGKNWSFWRGSPLVFFFAMMYAGQPSIMAEMFPTRVRLPGVSSGYQVTSIVAVTPSRSSPPAC
jgi:hypothetical protein